MHRVVLQAVAAGAASKRLWMPWKMPRGAPKIQRWNP